ncbi:MAG: hypothetical protein AAFR38_02085 [Planctomycetota bacterium]
MNERTGHQWTGATVTALLVAGLACLGASGVRPAAAAAADEAGTRSSEDQLGFWVGSWDCYGRSGSLNGTNTLEWRVGGRVIHESWRAVDDTFGESWNWFDQEERAWKQVWVDQNGSDLEFTGEPEGSGIRFRAERETPEGRALVEMFVRPIEHGWVRQTGTRSLDGGATWEPRYDLIYVPTGEPYDHALIER